MILEPGVSMKTVRERVHARARGRCECGCNTPLRDSWQCDHYFGRAKAVTSVETCWGLNHDCHYAKTNNSPSAAHWHYKFISHALLFGYAAEAERAETKPMVLRAKGRAS